MAKRRALGSRLKLQVRDARLGCRRRKPASPPRLALPAAAATVLLLAGCAGQPAQRPAAEPDATQHLLQTVEREHGAQAAERVRRWFRVIETGQRSEDHTRLHLANDFFNQPRFTTDEDVWRQPDYWATPVEFLIMDAGDCEEFAIAKYFTLARMGVTDAALRITYVKALSLNQPHMVLAWYETPAADPLILDNLEPRILPASQRPDLIPVYSFNGTDLWLARSRREQVRSGDATTLSHWRKLRERFAKQLVAP